ncbi:Splicing factor U2AF 26 kDa subunit, partial [Galemys pyrenaicus]
SCSTCTGIHRIPPKPQTDGTVSEGPGLGAGLKASGKPLPDPTLPSPPGHVSNVEGWQGWVEFPVGLELGSVPPGLLQEVFTELQEKYREIEEMNVCDNLGDHLFRCEEIAEWAVAELNNCWFNGQAVHAELSPVTDFRESCCWQYKMGYGSTGGTGARRPRVMCWGLSVTVMSVTSARPLPRECTRGGFCNFMHLRPSSWNLRQKLWTGTSAQLTPRPHIGHSPQERNRRRSPDHRHGHF